LRHDNADLRLREKGYRLGIIDEERYQNFSKKKELIELEIERLRTTKVRPTAEVQTMLRELGTAELNNAIDLATLLRRPEVSYNNIEAISPAPVLLTDEVKEQVLISIKYSGYIEKQLLQVDKLKKLESKKIPDWVDYRKIGSLSLEAKEKLNKIMPLNIGQASRISGVSPADISILLIYIEQGRKELEIK